jgi:hypothetical protein
MMKHNPDHILLCEPCRSAAKVVALLSLLAAVFLTLWGVWGCSPKTEPCSENDTVMILHAAECRQRVETECRDLPDNQCPAVRECDAWGRARCGIPDPVDAEATADADGGSAGAQ